MGPPRDVTATEKGGSLAKTVWETTLEQIQWISSLPDSERHILFQMCKAIAEGPQCADSSGSTAPGLLPLGSFENQVRVLLSRSADKSRKRPAELWVWTTATQALRCLGFYPIKTHREEPGKADLSE